MFDKPVYGENPGESTELMLWMAEGLRIAYLASGIEIDQDSIKTETISIALNRPVTVGQIPDADGELEDGSKYILGPDMDDLMIAYFERIVSIIRNHEK